MFDTDRQRFTFQYGSSSRDEMWAREEVERKTEGLFQKICIIVSILAVITCLCVFIPLLMKRSTSNKDAHCPPVDPPKRSSIVSVNPYVNYVDDTVTIQCDKGTYFPDKTSRKSITCLKSEEWNTQLPDCQNRICPDIKDSMLVNAELLKGNLTKNEYKDTVVIKCNVGFTFDLTKSAEFAKILLCEGDGHWDADVSSGCQDFNECTSNPCQNYGTCTDGINGYTCNCPGDFTGTMCETVSDVDDCETVSCKHGGRCIDGFNDYTCFCVTGYEGEQCEIDRDECSSDPCLSGGTCLDGVNGYNCTCAEGFIGSHCESDFYECSSSPCLNYGNCVDGVNGYSCSCPLGFPGVHCEIDFNECSSDPCVNDGTCVDGPNRFDCTCTSGYAGDSCEIDVSECSSDPCVNDGTCVDGPNRFDCICKSGYGGDTCEIKLGPCGPPSPCDEGWFCAVTSDTTHQCYL